MRIELVCFTDRGEGIGRRLLALLRAAGDDAALERCGAGGGSLGRWTAERFSEADALVFIGACGIAVRAVAPHLASKIADPAVVVVDHAGRFAIPLLSGHVGGANALARRLAALIGAEPVVTTATDAEGVFAVDVWAAGHGLAIVNPEGIKTVSAALLAGRGVGLRTPFPTRGTPPAGVGVNPVSPVAAEIVVDVRPAGPEGALLLAPPALALGVGCRRGIAEEAIAEAFAAFCRAAELLPEAFGAVCTIDLKRDEAGLIAFCRRRGLPLRTFAAEALAAVAGAYSASEFVRAVAGVDNVCERSAVAGSGGGRLLAGKSVFGGVTLAAALGGYAVDFSDAGTGDGA